MTVHLVKMTGEQFHQYSRLMLKDIELDKIAAATLIASGQEPTRYWLVDVTDKELKLN